MTSELKPCPFCGGPARMEGPRDVGDIDMKPFYIAGCFLNFTDKSAPVGCGVTQSAYSPYDTAKKWNTRTEQASQAQVPEAYKLVPIEPTDEMLAPFNLTRSTIYMKQGPSTNLVSAYRTMLEAIK